MLEAFGCPGSVPSDNFFLHSLWTFKISCLFDSDTVLFYDYEFKILRKWYLQYFYFYSLFSYQTWLNVVVKVERKMDELIVSVQRFVLNKLWFSAVMVLYKRLCDKLILYIRFFLSDKGKNCKIYILRKNYYYFTIKKYNFYIVFYCMWKIYCVKIQYNFQFNIYLD